MTTVNSLDLFSGIGGLTLALEGALRPVAYCDNWDVARAVLAYNMSRKLLPAAPVCNDVLDIKPSWFQEQGSKLPQIEAIVAGFPCVGFSTAGKRRGLRDDRSALFYQVMRVLDDFTAPRGVSPVLFLENVPPVLHALPEIMREMRARGYSLWWCLLPASSVGSPQRRMRWYGVAHRQDADSVALRQRILDRLQRSAPWATRDVWARRKGPARMVPAATSSRRAAAHARFATLGNAVVPQAARHAYVHLLRQSCTPDALSVPLTVHRGGQWPTHGCCTVNPRTQRRSVFQLPEPDPLRTAPAQALHLDPAAYKPPSGTMRIARHPTCKRPVHKHAWNTPLSNCVSPSNYLTVRSCNDLPTQLRFERSTPAASRGGQPNPAFVEWLMGFPPSWTHAVGRLYSRTSGA